jgi:hypothetical protein
LDSKLSLLFENKRLPKPHVFKEVPNLGVIFAGPNKSIDGGHFNSPRFKNMLINSKKKFDIVIIDSPPALLVSETCEMATQADLVVVVVKANSTKVTHLRRCLSLIEGVSKRCDGLILNMTPDSRIADEYGYGYGYGYGSIRHAQQSDNSSKLYGYDGAEYLKMFESYTNSQQSKTSHTPIIKFILDRLRSERVKFNFSLKSKNISEIMKKSDSVHKQSSNDVVEGINVETHPETWEKILKKIMDQQNKK